MIILPFLAPVRKMLSFDEHDPGAERKTAWRGSIFEDKNVFVECKFVSLKLEWAFSTNYFH